MFQKVYTNFPGPCMDVAIAFNGFLLQNAFIQIKICFIGHIIVRLNIYRSFDIFRVFFIHLNTVDVSFLVQYMKPYRRCVKDFLETNMKNLSFSIIRTEWIMEGNGMWAK